MLKGNKIFTAIGIGLAVIIVVGNLISHFAKKEDIQKDLKISFEEDADMNYKFQDDEDSYEIEDKEVDEENEVIADEEYEDDYSENTDEIDEEDYSNEDIDTKVYESDSEPDEKDSADLRINCIMYLITGLDVSDSLDTLPMSKDYYEEINGHISISDDITIDYIDYVDGTHDIEKQTIEYKINGEDVYIASYTLDDSDKINGVTFTKK